MYSGNERKPKLRSSEIEAQVLYRFFPVMTPAPSAGCRTEGKRNAYWAALATKLGPFCCRILA
jgi:hypothetical protein